MPVDAAAHAEVSDECRAFAEDPHRYILEVDVVHLPKVQAHLDGIAHAVIGTVTNSTTLEVVGIRTPQESMTLDTLRAAWNAPTGG